MKKTVTHLIVGLGKGGAETMLYQVLKYRTDPELTYRVISFGASHYYEQPIRELGFDVIELSLKKKPVSSLLRLPGLVRGSDTLCCWMYHANFLGFLAGRLAGVKKIIWCIRRSDFGKEITKKRTMKINFCCSKISKHVDIVSYNGELSRKRHEEYGYYPGNGIVLENGCDCSMYFPNQRAGAELRQDLSLPNKKKIILSVTRYHPVKDIPTFLKAFSFLKRTNSDIVAVLCGNGVTSDNPRLSSLCEENHLLIGEDVFFLGVRNDVPKLMAGCDLYVLHSVSEAFPNALIQAMSCGCLCVATDVGDARRILDNDHCIISPGDASALSNKMFEMLKLSQSECEKLRTKNRKTVQEKFEIRKIIKDYEGLF